MGEMKNSGIEWIGVIPNEWCLSKMKYIGQYINGYAFKPEDWGNSGKRIIRIQDLTRYNDNPNFFDGEIDAKYLVKAGDILVSWAATLDAFIWEQEDGWLNQHIFKAIPNEKIVKFEYFYWLIKEAMQNMANENLHGIMMQHVTLGLFGNYAIPLPPIEEQQKIASFLDRKCAEIDAVIEKTKATIEEYKKLKQSVITEAVTKGIRGERPMKDSGIEWIGDICYEYDVCRMKFLLSEPLMYGANETGIPYEETLPRYIRITDITGDGKLKDNSKLSLSEDAASPYILKDNDVLFARSGGTVGKAFIYKKEYGKSAFAGYLIKASTNDKLLSDYLFYYTQSSLYEEWKKQIFIQATIQNIGADRYNNLPIVLPSVEEQYEIVSYLQKKCTEMDTLIAKKTALLEEMESYKKSVIYEYVTGKKEVR